MTDRIPRPGHRPASPDDFDLPVLSAERMDAIERRVLDRINSDRNHSQKRGTRRVWLGASAAAAVVVAAAMVAPTAISAIGGSTMSYSAGSASTAEGDRATEVSAPAPADGAAESEISDSSEGVNPGGSDLLSPESPDDRSIIANGSVTLRVEDVQDAADDLAARARELGGFVESADLDTTSDDDSTVSGSDPYLPESIPYRGSNWVQIRIPAENLVEAIDDLSEVGEVIRSSVTRQDVTQTTIDLQAQVESAEASVARLTELMNEAGSLSDLIAAESALTERQWALQSAQQQLESLQGQVDMSTLTITLTPEAETVTPDPAGFGDGFAAGWNGLLAAVNALVIGLGFLIPWLGVLGVASLLVWLVVRRVRRRRAAQPGPPSDDH